MEAFITLAIIAAIIAVVILNRKEKARRLEQLRQAYAQSLKGNSKRLALEAGRAYYCALRKDKVLTMYDEQAITNDLSTMSDFAGSSQIQ
jgi:hypothetical protein